MPRVYTAEELTNILNRYGVAETKDAAVADAEQLLRDFTDDKADIAPDALDVFNTILETFGTFTDTDGTVKLNEIGARALARYEALISELEAETDAADTHRIHALTSDQNQIKFDLLTLEIYRDLGLVDADTDASELTPGEISEIIATTPVDDAMRAKYAAKFVEKTSADPELFELVPPKILADAYMVTRAELQKNPTDKSAQARFATLAKRMDYLIKNFGKKADIFIADPSNIADVYRGYRKMCDVRRADLAPAPTDNAATKEYKKTVATDIKETEKRLAEIVELYSEMWNLKDLTPADAEKLNKRWDQISDSLATVTLNNETLATLAKYQFNDADGKPMPQFLDADGNESLEFKPDYTLNPNGRLARIIDLARGDVTMRNVGDLDTDVKDMDLTAALFDRVPWKMAEINIPDAATGGIESDAPMTRAQVDEFWDKLGREGGKISDTGYQAALDAQVNMAAGFASMMAEKIGDDKAVIFRPFESVVDIDKLAETRSERLGAAERKQKVGFFRRMVKNFSAAAVVSAGLTFIGKATGVAYAGAAVGTTIGVGNMFVQGFKWRRAQKKAGKPYGLKEFLSDKRNWGPAVASGLGVAAVISMATGNPELAAGFGVGAMAVGGGTAAVATYQDAVAAGYSRGAAVAGAIGVVGATIAGGLAGRAAMNGVVNYVNNNTESTLFKTEQITGTEQKIIGTERTYEDGIISNNERILNLWENPESLNARLDGLMDAGLTHDDAVRYLLAWHDATDHNLGPGYFNSIGMDADALAAFRQSINGTSINITPDAMAAFEHFNPHISATNTVGYYPGAPVDYGLPGNAAYDANGVLIPGHDVYSSFVNHSGNIFTDVPIISSEITSIFTPNELAFPGMIGTFGVYEPRVVPPMYMDRLRERASALADRAAKTVAAHDETRSDADKDPTDKTDGVDGADTGGAGGDKDPTDKTDGADATDTGGADGAETDEPDTGGTGGTDGDKDPTDKTDGVDGADTGGADTGGADGAETGEPDTGGTGGTGGDKDPTDKTDGADGADTGGADAPDTGEPDAPDTGGAGGTGDGTGGGTPGDGTADGTGDATGDTDDADKDKTGKPSDGTDKADGADGADKSDPTKPGFFERVAHFITRFQRWHGNRIKETQKLIGELKMDHIKNKTEREIAKAELAKQRNKREMVELSGKSAKQMKELNEKIKRDKKALEGQYDLADVHQKRKIQARIAELDAIGKEVATFREIGGEDAMAERLKIAELESKYNAVVAQGEIDVEMVRTRGAAEIELAKAQGKTKVEEEKASKARSFGHKIRNAFKGIGDKTKEDVTAADTAAKVEKKKAQLEKNKLATTIARTSREVWDAASGRLAEIMESHEYTPEQKEKLAAAVLEETMRQFQSK